MDQPIRLISIEEVPPGDDEHRDCWQQALALVQAGQIQTGLALLKQEFGTARSQGERLLSQLRLAELCVLANKPALAKPFVEELVATVEALHLREWEPAESNVCAWRAATAN